MKAESLRCPRTGQTMTRARFGRVDVDVSEGCGGVWFDRFELEKFDEIDEIAGTMLAEHVRSHHRKLGTEDRRLKCPRDADVVMMRRFYSGDAQIEIDECPQCGGIWLDAEELDAIRDKYPTRAAFEKAQSAYMERVMKSPETQRHIVDEQASTKKLLAIARLLWSAFGTR